MQPFFMPCCYILYSDSSESFYVGSTVLEASERLEQHNSKYYPNKFTARGIPWKLFFVIECDSISQARKIELHIKSMKSKKYLFNLTTYPDMVISLKERYKL